MTVAVGSDMKHTYFLTENRWRLNTAMISR